MKKIILFIIISLMFTNSVLEFANARTSRTKSSDVYVKGYYKKDGTYVNGYYRSAPDGIKSNNYSCIDYGQDCGNTTSTISHENKTCELGYKMNIINGLCEKIYIPLNGHLNSNLNDYECDYGYKRDYLLNACNKIIIPENSYLNSEGTDFFCNYGYIRDYVNNICEKVIVPEHGFLNIEGTDFICEEGYIKDFINKKCTLNSKYEEREILQDINLREKAGIKGKKIIILYKGNIVNIIDSIFVGNRKWYKIQYNEYTGYISEIGFINK